MKKIFPILFLLFMIPWFTLAQGVSSYTVSRQTSIVYTSINTTGTSIPSSSWRSGANQNDNRSMPLPLTFTFNYLGVPYSSISVSTNGFIDFSSSTAGGLTAGAYSSDNTTFSQPSPNGTLLALAPFYEDIMCPLGFNLGNTIKYLVSGSAGNRVFTIEWYNMAFPSSTNDHVTFQVKLYEADARIEFIYGPMTVAGITPSYTCGINSSAMSGPPTSAQLLTQQTPNSTTFGIIPQNALNAIPEPNSMLIFTACPIPYAAGTITGLTSVCENSAGVTYAVAPIGFATGYNWVLPAGFTIASGANTNTISVNIAAGSPGGTLSVTGTSVCGNGTSSSISITVKPRPAITVTGPASACNGVAGNVYATQTSMSGYLWTISGGTITAGGTSTSSTATVTWDTVGNQSISVNYNAINGCNAINPTTFPVTVNPLPVPVITGPMEACAGSAGNLYTTTAGMTSYVWSVSGGGTITAGGTSTSNTATVKWNTAGTQTVTVNYQNSNGCAANPPTAYPVLVNPLPVPIIAGPSEVCTGTAGHVYITESNMTNYTWSVSTGGTITAGTGTNSITVTWSQSGSKSVSVGYTNSNLCTSLAPTAYPVTVYPLPVPTIDGPVNTCTGIGGYIYTTETGMSDYLWTISSGGTINGGLGTDAITVTWNTIGAQSVTVAYTNQNGCITGTPVIKSVTVHSLPVPSISGNNTPCANSGNHPYTTETGMTGYIWAVSPGGTITSGSGTYKINVSWIGTGPQWVSVNYTNTYTCQALLPTLDTVNVNELPGPVGTITGEQIFCGAAVNIPYSVAPVPNATTYAWNLPPGAVIVSGGGTPSITVNYPTNASSGSIIVFANNSCGAGPQSPPLPIQFTPVPETPVISQAGDLMISSVINYNQWYLNGVALPGATSQYYTAVDTGIYWDQASVNSCSSDTSNHIYVSVITGTGEVKPRAKFIVYPVPCDGRFTVNTDLPDDGSIEFTVYNQVGMAIYSEDVYAPKGNFRKNLDLRPLPGGIYTIKLKGASWQATGKIIVGRW